MHVGDLFDPNYLLEPPLLAGCNKDESDQKSAANIYKSVHMTSRRRKFDSPCNMIEKDFLMIVKCPFKKIKILCLAMKGLGKSFRMMYSNIGLKSHETVPLMYCSGVPVPEPPLLSHAAHAANNQVNQSSIQRLLNTEDWESRENL